LPYITVVRVLVSGVERTSGAFTSRKKLLPESEQQLRRP
jgi:hypothetical protein